jgi:hydroxyethylthiazole kinase-like uncharacterized protein yjeF
MKSDTTISKMKKILLKDVVKLLPKRKEDAHKKNGGKTLIIAGSASMPGAGLLSATAAARVGSGYVYLLQTSESFFSKNFPDFIILKKKELKNTLSRFNSIAIGPGLGNSLEAQKFLKTLLQSKFPFVVVDADALNILSNLKNVIIPESWIMTPHEEELARLLKKSSKKIHQNREDSILAAQKKFGCLVLLKGKKTLIASKNTVFQIQTGNKALAKAGTGDVLTGMIAGFIAQGLSPLNAACLSASLHGKIADEWILKKDYLGLMASDLLTQIPLVMKKLRTLSKK